MVPEGRFLPAGVVALAGVLEEVFAAVLPALRQVSNSLQYLDVVCHKIDYI